MWATLGNILKVSAVFGFLGVGLMGYRAIQMSQLGTSRELILPLAAATIGMFLLTVLLWNLKGPLVSGNPIARFLVGLYFLIGVFTSLGFSLLIIGVFYLFTGEPSAYETQREGRPARPRFSPPRGWHPTGQIGPSGAMAYSESNREGSTGIFDSWTPVQVTERENGLARVVSATGQAGWIDARTIIEGGV